MRPIPSERPTSESILALEEVMTMESGTLLEEVMFRLR
jgi:hypothetical protein